MEMNQIREFIVLAKTCNYQTASEALFTTSSTLSRHISQMEKELDSQLFDRTTRKVTLTEAGSVFLEKCQQIVSLYDGAVTEMKSVTPASNNLLTVAYASNMRQYGILDITYALSEQYPKMDIRMSESSDHVFNSLLHTNAIDFAFSSRLELFDNDVIHHKFCADDLVLILPKGHPLADRDALQIEELKDELFVIYNFYQTSDRFLAECKNHGFTANVKITMGNSFATINAVAHNQGISVLSRMRYLELLKSSRYEALSAVTPVDIIPKLPFNIYLLYLKNRPLTPAMKTYLNYITKIWPMKNLESDTARPSSKGK